MLRVAITGNIGSGKTYVSRLFAMLGVPIFYADQYAKQAFQQTSIQQLIIKASNKSPFLPNGKIDKAILLPLLISNTPIAEEINKQIHIFTIKGFEQWSSDLEKQGEVPYCIKESAIIFESTVKQEIDYTIGVYAPTAIRKKRFLEREAETSITKFETIDNNQVNSAIKMKLVDKVIDNYNHKALLPQVIAIHHSLIGNASSSVN